MLLTEFDEEREWKLIAEGFEEIGFEKGIKSVINTMLTNGVTRDTIMKQMNISENELEKILAS
jgi:hypothetical protein